MATNLVPERQEQLQKLIDTFIVANNAHRPVFVFGSKHTGKTLTIKSLLQHINSKDNWDPAEKKPLVQPFKFVYVDAVSCISQPNLLLAQILNKAGYPESRSETTATFLSKISEWCQKEECVIKNEDEEEVVDAFTVPSESVKLLILDSAEKLLFMNQHIMGFFLRLGELSEGRLRVVFISNNSFDLFCGDAASFQPITIFFPDYSKRKVASILMKDFLETYQGQLPPWATNFTSFEEFQNCFMGLSDIIVSSLYDITLNIYDMIHVARRLFPKYIEPVVSGRQPANSKHLMDAVQSDLRYGLVSIMKREPSGKLWKMGETEKLTTAQKYLLIAAFIASYNDAKHDAKFFGNVTTSRKKGKGRVGKGPRMNTFQLGPKAFAADRALAIFFHILEEPLEPSIDIYIQFVSLISKGYLTRINGAALHKNFTAGLKCKCNTKYNYVKSIADSVDFKLDNYLILS